MYMIVAHCGQMNDKTALSIIILVMLESQSLELLIKHCMIRLRFMTLHDYTSSYCKTTLHPVQCPCMIRFDLFNLHYKIALSVIP